MKNNDTDQNSFVGHLAELRSRLIRTFIFLLVSFIVCYIFSARIYEFLVQPYADVIIQNNLNRRLIFTALHEAFLTYLKVAFFAAFFITSPIFNANMEICSPRFIQKRKTSINTLSCSYSLLFLFGGMLVYYLIMPLAIKFFLTFETVADSASLSIQLEAKVNEYLSLIMRLIFAFGLSFQLPVVLSLLARIGVVNSKYLKERRRYVIVIIFAIAAILTPPDPITQIGLALPLLILYELSIFAVKFIENKKDA